MGISSGTWHAMRYKDNGDNVMSEAHASMTY
jgi:hypothetical protein